MITENMIRWYDTVHLDKIYWELNKEIVCECIYKEKNQ